MKYLLLCLLLIASQVFAGTNHYVLGIVTSSGPTCSGDYGYDSTPTDANVYASPGTMVLQKITLDCSATSATWEMYLKYVLYDDEKFLPVIYNSSGSLVWSGTAMYEYTGSKWWTVATSTISLSSGDYYVGAQFESSNNKFNRVANTGVDYIRYDVTFGTVPSSITIGSPDNTYSNYNLDVKLSF